MRHPAFQRLCIVCKADINDRGPQSRRCLKHQIEEDRRRRKQHHSEALGARQGKAHHVWADPNRVPIKHCGVCGGMPWARLPIRQLDSSGQFAACYTRFGEPVAMPAGKGVPGHHVPVCRGCGEEYAPEQKLEHATIISSSAGMAIKVAW